MKTKTVNMYDFEELSEKAQEAALQEIASFNSNYEWWESVYEDAEMAGLKITSFDLDRNRHAEGDFVHSAEIAQTTSLTITANNQRHISRQNHILMTRHRL